VNSALASGSEMEVIVVDDASVDATASVCASLNNIQYIRLMENHGTAGAGNVGIKAGHADFICFHDDDGLEVPRAVDGLVELLEAQPSAGLAYGQIFVGDETLSPIEGPCPAEIMQGDLFWRLVEGNFIPTLSVLFRKDCLSHVGMVNPALKGVDDY